MYTRKAAEHDMDGGFIRFYVFVFIFFVGRRKGDMG